jgi:hypothetical protein
MTKLIPIILLSTLCMAAGGQMSIEEARNAGAGASVTVTGMILNGPELGIIRYIQDSTAAIAVYPGSGSVPLNAARGDIITVSGTNKIYANLLEVDVLTNVEILSSGNDLPPPVLITPDQGCDFRESAAQFRGRCKLHGQLPGKAGTGKDLPRLAHRRFGYSDGTGEPDRDLFQVL